MTHFPSLQILECALLQYGSIKNNSSTWRETMNWGNTCIEFRLFWMRCNDEWASQNLPFAHVLWMRKDSHVAILSVHTPLLGFNARKACLQKVLHPFQYQWNSENICSRFVPNLYLERSTCEKAEFLPVMNNYDSKFLVNSTFLRVTLTLFFWPNSR